MTNFTVEQTDSGSYVNDNSLAVLWMMLAIVAAILTPIGWGVEPIIGKVAFGIAFIFFALFCVAIYSAPWYMRARRSGTKVSPLRFSFTVGKESFDTNRAELVDIWFGSSGNLWGSMRAVGLWVSKNTRQPFILTWTGPGDLDRVASARDSTTITIHHDADELTDDVSEYFGPEGLRRLASCPVVLNAGEDPILIQQTQIDA